MKEKDFKDLVKRVEKLEEDNNLYKIKIQKLEDQVAVLESGEKNTGVYLEGAPEYVVDFIKKENREKVGE